jgi:TrmH family RNA methyltransferase
MTDADRPHGRYRVVTSHANPLVKQIRALSRRKARRETGWFLAEGLKLVSEAIATGWHIRILVHAGDEDSLLLQSAVQATIAAGGDVLDVSPAILESLANRDNPRGVLGVFEQRQVTLESLDIGTDDLWVALDRVRDPGNLGTIIRTCDAVGAAGVILVGDCTDPFGVEAVRATMGSIFQVPIAAAAVGEFISWRSSFAGLVVGTHLAAATDFRSVSYRRATLLVMGNEQAGLSDELAEVCDELVKIPMAGAADSLNLAVSTGIMLYELKRPYL